MPVLFRVEQNPESNVHLELLGFKWIEVLAIEPWALGHPGEEYGDWCYKTIKTWYICNTDAGFMRLTSDDFWAAIEDYKELHHAQPNEQPPLIITAGPSAIVQINSELAGHAITGSGEIVMRDSYSAGQAGIQGPNASGNTVNFGQQWSQNAFDSNILSDELAILRAQMRKTASTLEQDAAVGAVANAEIAVRQGNGPKALEYLASTGSWALDMAGKIGVGVATAALKAALGV
jgi:hypothetical protein